MLSLLFIGVAGCTHSEAILQSICLQTLSVCLQESQAAPTLKPFTSSPHQQPALQGLHHTQQGIPFVDIHTLDEDDDYCKTYAVLVEGLKQLLDKLDTEGSDADLHLQLQNQTRHAVSVPCSCAE